MKQVLGAILLFVGLSTIYANDEGERMAIQVQIVSDELDENIPDGTCKVTGEVYFLGELFASAEVCSFKGQKCMKTGRSGEFSMVVDTSESYIYATVMGAQTSYLQNYKFKSQHHLKVRFYIEVQYQTVKKPVIYLYSDEKLSLNLSLKTAVELTFTYPKYDKGWQVEVDPIEGLSVNGESYPYLFWEGKDVGTIKYATSDNQLIGEIIKTDTGISYLRNQTKHMGLNSTESTDFITFWGPVLSSHEYAFVQFAVDEAYNQVAEIESSQVIQNQRRIFMLYESFDQQPIINCTTNQARISTFVRGGLTLVERGGAEINLPKL